MQRREEPEQPEPSLPGPEGMRLLVAERHEPQPVAPSRRNVADCNRDALGDVGLTTVGCAEVHRRRGVKHEPRDEHTLSQMHTYVRDVCARGDIPVDAAHVVVSGDIGTHLRELGPVAEKRRAIVASKQTFHPAPDADVECTQQRLRQRPRPRPRRCRLGVERWAHRLLFGR